MVEISRDMRNLHIMLLAISYTFAMLHANFYKIVDETITFYNTFVSSIRKLLIFVIAAPSLRPSLPLIRPPPFERSPKLLVALSVIEVER